jgi:hypothetical protein
VKSAKAIHRCCFTCRYWTGNRRTGYGRCMRYHPDSILAIGCGNELCCLWDVRPNARLTVKMAKECDK